MRALVIAWVETVRSIRDRGALFWMLLFPGLYATLFGLVQFGGSPSARLGLCVANGDTGPVGCALRNTLERFALEMTDTIASRVYGREDRLVIKDVGDAPDLPDGCVRLLRIPEGLTDTLLAGGTATLEVHEGTSGNELASFAARAITWRAIIETVARLAVASLDSADASRAFEAASRRPPRVSVEASFVDGVVGPPSGFTQSVPGTVVMMALLILATHGSATLVVERRRGLLLHLASTPASRGEIIAGKLIGRFLIGVAQVLLLWILAIAAQETLGVWVGYQLLEAIPVLLAFAGAAAGIGFCLAAAARSEQMGVGVGVATALVMAALGGCWWPLEIVPRPLQLIGHAFPTAWAMDALHRVLRFNQSVATTLPQMGILAAYGLVSAWAGARLFRCQ